GAGGGAADGGGADGSKIIDSFACEEDWYCSDWSVCYENETQSRTCTDLNACQTINDKPPVLQECIFEGDCFDGVQNGLEEGIDCGGLCEPCPWQIGEPSCFDGIQNQGERGVDCEGPCQKECKKKKPLLEFPMKVCKREFNLTNPVYWLFVLIVLIAITTDLTYSYQRINRVRRNEEIEDLKRAKTIIHTKRNMYIFIIIIVLMSLGLLAYYYYYSQCSSYLIDFLWLVISVFILVPVIGYTTLKILEYDEREKIMKMEKYFEAHHSHITHLISMHNKYLVEIENDISNEIYQLQSDDKFKDVLENYPQIREAYKEMIILYDKYKETSTPFDEERRLCKDMEELIKNKEFVKLTTSFPKIKKLYDDLVLLYKQYEEKQKMYDDLFREERKTKQE
ncbi:hypothetical protein GOV05_01565, partial [Candidatus Woesearchaeota archaeon]|nr:hypothetical protein [Candidatus Woesearchaeota archaeon]